MEPKQPRSTRATPLLNVVALAKDFPLASRKKLRALQEVSFTLFEGETLGIVGESGSGKSTLGRTILRLYKPDSGRIFFRQQEIGQLCESAMKPLRRHIQMIFQDPYSSLNPRLTVGETLLEPLQIHSICPPQKRKEYVFDLLQKVGLLPHHYRRYPHEFSGGQRQRIGIARALAVQPQLLICDEPVSALDVSIQAQIINLLQDLQVEHRLTYLFIAHDLAVVRHISNRIAVMYLGHIVELACTEDLYTKPLHPYTESLLSAIPLPDPKEERARARLNLVGEPPSPIDLTIGCPFASRCPKAFAKCHLEKPSLREREKEHQVACHLFDPTLP